MKPYFSHDEGARNDPKLVRVLMRLGQAGKGVYWDLVEMLHEQGGYLPLGDLESMAFGLRTDLPTLISLLNDFGLFSQDAERFWSESGLTRLQLRNAKAEARAAAGAKGGKARAEKLALLQQIPSNASQDCSNATALPAETLASKEKKRKLKETKVNPLPSVEDADSAAAPLAVEDVADIVVGDTSPESPATKLRTPGGAADVGTSVEAPAAPLKASRGGRASRPRRTVASSLPDVPFSQSAVASFEDFAAAFAGTDYALADLQHYHQLVATWRDKQTGEEPCRKDWVATAKRFMLNDRSDNRLKLAPGVEPYNPATHGSIGANTIVPNGASGAFAGQTTAGYRSERYSR